MTLKEFKKLVKLVNKLHQEILDNAQGDSGYDVKQREMHYCKQVEKFLSSKND